MIKLYSTKQQLPQNNIQSLLSNGNNDIDFLDQLTTDVMRVSNKITINNKTVVKEPFKTPDLCKNGLVSQGVDESFASLATCFMAQGFTNIPIRTAGAMSNHTNGNYIPGECSYNVNINSQTNSVEYFLKIPIVDQSNMVGEGSNSKPMVVTKRTLKYTISKDGQLQAEVENLNDGHAELWSKIFYSVASTFHNKEEVKIGFSKNTSKKDDLLNIFGMDCNQEQCQLVTAIENNQVLKYLNDNKLSVEIFKSKVEEVASSLSVVSTLKLNEEFYLNVPKNLEYVKTLDMTLSKTPDGDLGKLARGIDKNNTKDNFKDNQFQSNNNEIYNALSDESKAKIDIIGDKLSDKRDFITKIIDYLKGIFSAASKKIMADLTRKPEPEDLKLSFDKQNSITKDQSNQL